jgi:hypothetical protein
LLDQTLRDMGPETQAARGLLRQSTVLALRYNWPEEAGVAGDSWGEVTANVVRGFPWMGDVANPIWQQGAKISQLLNEMRIAVIELPAKGEADQVLHASAIRLSESVVEKCWMLHQRTRTRLLPSFMLMLTFWITAIFVSFGYNSPRNAVVVMAFFIGAAAVAACFFLVVEMDTPFQGVLKISSHAMHDALDHMSE